MQATTVLFAIHIIIGLVIVYRKTQESRSQDMAFGIFVKESPFIYTAFAFPYVVSWPITIFFGWVGGRTGELSLGEIAQALHKINPEYSTEESCEQESCK